MSAIGQRSRLYWLELALLLCVLAGLAETVHRLVVDGHLPQPFIFDIYDTFMDWFNTASYAHQTGAFDIWRTVYPPLSFVFLSVFGDPTCYQTTPVYARDCDVVGIASLLIFYLAGIVLAYLAFRKREPATAPIRGLAFAFGLPMLFTLERGNLIIPCMVAFILAHSDLLRSRVGRALAAAVTINFKPYLVLPVLAAGFRRDWRRLELAGIATIIVYLLTYAALGDGSPQQILANTGNWVEFGKGLLWEAVYYTTSYMPFLEFDTYRFPTRDFIDSRTLETFVAAIPVVVRISQAAGALALIGAWLQPRAVDATRIAILLLATSLIGQSPGGYTETFLVFLMFLERYERPWPIVALVMAYLLSIPYDYMLSRIVELYGDSWLSGRTVSAPFGFSVGIFLRPGLIIVIVWALAFDTIGQVARANRGRAVRLGLGAPAPA